MKREEMVDGTAQRKNIGTLQRMVPIGKDIFWFDSICCVLSFVW